MFIECDLTQLFPISWKYYSDWKKPPTVKKVTWIKPPKEWMSDKDTYLVIFSNQPGYKEMYELLSSTPEIKIIYQSVPAVNLSKATYDKNPRNFLVVFELCEPSHAQNVEKMEKTQEAIISSALLTEENIASLVNTTSQQTELPF